jgi:iron(III) transport system permease protein
MSYYRFSSNRLTCIIALCVFVTLLPIPYLASILIKGGFSLPIYLTESFIMAFINGLVLAMITSLFALLWAVPAGLLLSFYDFSYKKLWVSLLIMPIAIPAYLNAYVYSDLLYYTGYFALWYKNLTGHLIPFNMRSTIGAAFVLSLSLYPYIFFPLYLRLRSFPPNLFDYARTIGHKKLYIMIQSMLKSSMPVILFGISLIILETLADYGTVSYYGINTPSVFLFDIWQQTGDINIAVTITTIFLMITGIIFTASHHYQKQKNYNITKPSGHLQCFTFKTKIGFLSVMTWLVFIFFITFLIPIGFFLYYFFLTPLPKISFLTTLTLNSFMPTIIAGLLCIIIGFLFSYYRYHGYNKFLKSAIMVCCSGYAFPNVILGIAVYAGLLSLNREFNYVFNTHINVISGGMTGLIICYYIKFLTVSYSCLSPVFKTINPSLLQSAITSGYGHLSASKMIYTPFFKKPLIIAFILVVVDIVKELPATLLLRPFGFDTFATFTYNMAGLERIPEASSAALVLIFMGITATLIPIMTHIIKDSNSESF